MNKILLIDYFNIIKRYMSISSDMDNGTYIDLSVDAVMRSLTRTISMYSPSLVIVCMDNGKNKRAMSINSNYKANRSKSKSLTEKEKEHDRIEFAKQLIEIFPIVKVEQTNTEADQIIYYVYKLLSAKLEETAFIIASNDSDFVQLLTDENVILYDWKNTYTKDNFNESHKYLADFKNINNFALAKSLIGDTSDNIKGLEHLGWKTVNRLFEMIGSSTNLESIDHLLELMKYTKEHLTAKNELKFIDKWYNEISSNKDRLFKNQKLIDLSFLESPYVIEIVNSFRSSIATDAKFDTDSFRDLINSDMYKSKFEEAEDNPYFQKNYYLNYNIFNFQLKRTNTYLKMLRGKI